VESELDLQPHRSQEAQRIVDEDQVRDCANAPCVEIRSALERIARSTRSDPDSDRVEREVARGEIGFDAIRKRCEINGLRGVCVGYAPGSMVLRERKRSTTEPARVENGSLTRMAAGDIEVEYWTTEELVADCTSDDPGFLVAEYLANALIHP
jgi:hypothetical protein